MMFFGPKIQHIYTFTTNTGNKISKSSHFTKCMLFYFSAMSTNRLFLKFPVIHVEQFLVCFSGKNKIQVVYAAGDFYRSGKGFPFAGSRTDRQFTNRSAVFTIEPDVDN